eukprot:gb/GECG01013124.1/.p1 GENE.gb/GECG01013124.1/~~gb/GECG01013124.1/.p1  ORF type:complete len:691 (+),score=66.27 gb/GECG01013124.1/:1-2073(+)
MMITIGYLYADPILHEDGSPVQRIDFHLESRKIRQQLQQISPPVGPFAPVRRKERAETIDVRWLEAIATLENMKILLSKGIDILHYSGHGTPQGISFEQGVVEDDSVKQQQQLGVEKIVNTEELRNLLHDTHRPKLVLVSACHSEAVAQVFTDAGIPYVVSVPQDSSVEDISAISFAKCFYERLLRGETVRKAFERAQGIACSPRHQSTFTLLSPSSEPEDTDTSISRSNHKIRLQFDGICDECPDQPHRSIYGRDKLLQELYQSVCHDGFDASASRCIVLHGQSGLGKRTLCDSLYRYVNLRRSRDGSAFNALNRFRNILSVSINANEEDTLSDKIAAACKRNRADPAYEALPPHTLFTIKVHLETTKLCFTSDLVNLYSECLQVLSKSFHCTAVLCVSAYIKSSDCSEAKCVRVEPLNEDASTQLLAQCLGPQHEHLLQQLQQHEAFKGMLGNARVITDIAKELCHSGEADRLSATEVAWRREDCEDEILHQRTEASRYIANYLSRERQEQFHGDVYKATWEPQLAETAVLEFIKLYLQHLRQNRLDGLEGLTTQLSNYVTDGILNIYSYCGHILMPCLWLLTYGIKDWWDVDEAVPFIHGRACRPGEILGKGEFLYRLSGSDPRGVTVSWKDPGTWSIENMRIIQKRENFEFRFYIDNTPFRVWEDIHEHISRTLGESDIVFHPTVR